MTTFEACIVLIYEWLATKISSLEPNDLNGLVEWHDYIIEKAIAYTTK